MFPSSSPRTPRIAVVGGGPAGLTLGLLLHQHHIPATIFEYRPKPTEKDLAEPSGMLDLHEDSGLIAIRECGLWDDFVPLTGECAEVTKIADKNGRIVHEDNATKVTSRPEISRHNLTRLLTSQLPPETVKWEHKLVSATSRSTAAGHPETDLFFASHGKYTFDLVIGADGAFSKTRALVTDEKPVYAGKQIITLTIKHLSTKHPHLSKLVGPGTFMALGDHRAVVSQRGPMDSARIYVFLTSADEHFAVSSGVAHLSLAAAKDRLLTGNDILGGWGALLKELVGVACDEEVCENPGDNLDIRALYTLPDGTTWEHRDGVTLIGDAAHLMLPNGEGVNMAMLDAVLLSRAIVKANAAVAGNDHELVSFHNAFDPSLRAFELGEAARAKVVADGSRWLNETMYGEDGAEALAKAFFDA